jgi:hypothetical protein
MRHRSCGEDWKEGHGKARGRAETDRALGETHKLFDEISNMLTEMRRELLGRRQAAVIHPPEPRDRRGHCRPVRKIMLKRAG